MTPRLGAALVVGVALVRGLLLAGLIPPFHSPDEAAHFDYAQHLAESGRLPEQRLRCDAFSAEADSLSEALVFGPNPVAFHSERPLPSLGTYTPADPASAASRATTGCGPAAWHPPAYYLTVAAGYQAVMDEPFLTRLFAARMVSVAWGCLTAAAAFFLGLFFFGRAWDGLLLGLLVSCQPMVSFLSSVVNNDAAILACSTASFAAIAAAHRAGAPALVALSAAATLGALSKPSFTIYLPVLFVFCVAALGPGRRESWLKAALALAPSAAAVLAWSFVTRGAVAERMPTAETDLALGRYLGQYVFDASRADVLWIRMYWMAWGWVDTWLAPGYYRALTMCLVMAGLGIALGWSRFERRERWMIGLGVVSTCAVIVFLYAFEFVYVRITGEPSFIQGRYLLPLLPVHAPLLVLGLRAISRRLHAHVDGAWVFLALLALMEGAAVLRALGRYYV